MPINWLVVSSVAKNKLAAITQAMPQRACEEAEAAEGVGKGDKDLLLKDE
jgi:hypothetical protein